jgi:hypothetical protein
MGVLLGENHALLFRTCTSYGAHDSAQNKEQGLDKSDDLSYHHHHHHHHELPLYPVLFHLFLVHDRVLSLSQEQAAQHL